jgi:hypothetical protein
VIRRHIHSLCLISAMAVLTTTAMCQPRGGPREEALPDVGEQLPDITILDADGNDFHLRSLNNNYTVLVFGCLT